jgi:hypothetical protein
VTRRIALERFRILRYSFYRTIQKIEKAESVRVNHLIHSFYIAAKYLRPKLHLHPSLQTPIAIRASLPPLPSISNRVHARLFSSLHQDISPSTAVELAHNIERGARCDSTMRHALHLSQTSFSSPARHCLPQFGHASNHSRDD